MRAGKRGTTTSRNINKRIKRSRNHTARQNGKQEIKEQNE